MSDRLEVFVDALAEVESPRFMRLTTEIMVGENDKAAVQVVRELMERRPGLSVTQYMMILVSALWWLMLYAASGGEAGDFVEGQ